jgi:hypothetical protein
LPHVVLHGVVAACRLDGPDYWFSSEQWSAEHTSPLVSSVLQWLVPWLRPAHMRLVHAVVRKCAHLTEYAILALLGFMPSFGSRILGAVRGVGGAGHRSTRCTERSSPVGWRARSTRSLTSRALPWPLLVRCREPDSAPRHRVRLLAGHQPAETKPSQSEVRCPCSLRPSESYRRRTASKS